MEKISVTSLFQQLLHYRDRSADLSTLGPWLKHQVTGCSFPELNHLPFKTATYTRSCMAKENTDTKQGFQALIMRWDEQVQTPIHGHPAFSFYYVISGLFKMELFSYTTDSLQLQDTQLFYPSDTTWFLGEMGRYDNFIHRVTCLETGHTFHIYSEDCQQAIS
ncbi:MAG: hypothetical protein F6J96_01315 [Symploca sp. SIO1C2]|nr:hypothetical protein [Symploca sp. SIO1C2]